MSMTMEVDQVRQEEPGGNADFEWNAFDSASYHGHNYVKLHQNDLVFVKELRDFFAAELQGGEGLHGVDVGAGANLYPSLAMLPFCAELTLIDYSTSNVAWLQRETQSYAASWNPFWDILAEVEPYSAIDKPRLVLGQRAHAEAGSIFQLPREKWDLGTMFFVAESISERKEEFMAAVHGFIGALRPGAPFAAGFMENSTGYRWAPAPSPPWRSVIRMSRNLSVRSPRFARHIRLEAGDRSNSCGLYRNDSGLREEAHQTQRADHHEDPAPRATPQYLAVRCRGLHAGRTSGPGAVSSEPQLDQRRRAVAAASCTRPRTSRSSSSTCPTRPPTTCWPRCAVSATSWRSRRSLTGVLIEYLRTYTDEDGTPVFSGGSYFGAPTTSAEPSPRSSSQLDVVDSFSMSVTLMLARIGFLQGLPQSVPRRADLPRDRASWRTWPATG